MTASGADIWDVPTPRKPARPPYYHDEFHYAYMQVSGDYVIIAKVESITNTNAWAKAGVMIRQSLDANSAHVMTCLTPGSGVSLQHRAIAGDISTNDVNTTPLNAPYWVSLTRQGDSFSAGYSPDGSTWYPLGFTTVTMTNPIYIGLALTSHNAAATCTAVFSNVALYTVNPDGTVTPVIPLPSWTSHQDIGIKSNVAAPVYVTLQDSGAKTATITHDDPTIVLNSVWQAWDIALKDFAGVDLTKIQKITLGVGNVGTGTLYFDDIRLYTPRCVLTRRSADFAIVDYVRDCVVDYKDLEVMAENWLAAAGTVPNGDFEEIYKPGTAITAVVSDDGWTQGVGPDCPIDTGEYVFSDGTTGTVADIPGWVGYDRQGWIDNGGTYDRDQTTGNLQGSVSSDEQNFTGGGLQCYLANGGEWGNPAGGLIVSDAPLRNVEDGIYTLSMVANGGATPVVLDLLADGVILTPTSSVNPVLSGDWQEFSRTYDSGSLVGFLGKPLTIRLGVGRPASGGQTRFDKVRLFHSEDKKINFKDFAELAVWWLDEQLWPQ